MIDVLSRTYGWSFREIVDKMYWEEVYGMYEYASNLNMVERNSQMHFQVILHAGKKGADAWKDMPIPFPDERWSPPKEAEPLPKVFRDKAHVAKNQTPEEKERIRKRVAEIAARVHEMERRRAEAEQKRLYGNFNPKG